MLSFSLQDEFYQLKGIPYIRVISRAILFDTYSKKYLVHEIKRSDIFGTFTYLETPGGGVEENETLEETIRRECLEETGYQVKVIKELGCVYDEYNLIAQKNINHFFFCKTLINTGSKHLISKGDSLINRTLLLDIDEIIARYEKMNEKGLPLLVKRRELPFWKLVKKAEINEK